MTTPFEPFEETPASDFSGVTEEDESFRYWTPGEEPAASETVADKPPGPAPASESTTPTKYSRPATAANADVLPPRKSLGLGRLLGRRSR